MRLDSNCNNVCKSIDLKFSKIKLDTLAFWGGSEKTDTRLPLTDYSNLGGSIQNRSPFPLSKDINNRFAIWDGDITSLEVDAITSITDEGITDSNSLAEHIYSNAGNQLREELNNNIKECRTGEVYVTRGYNLPAKYVLHAVGPTFKEKCKTATECSLYSCYRNILYKAKELNLRTIAICNLSANQKNFPVDLAAHISLSTIRRFLSKFQTQIVILCVCSHERGIYEVLAPLYFPRDTLEAHSAQWHLPKHIGGEIGELQHPDRQIRIIRNPQHSVLLQQADDENAAPTPDQIDIESQAPAPERPRRSIVRSISDFCLYLYGQRVRAYTQMQGEIDQERLLGNTGQPLAGGGVEGVSEEERYERLLRRAQVEDLSSVSGIGCLYQKGVDRLGRPIIILCGKWFPANDIDLEKVLLYIIKLMDPIANGDYVIAYFHSLTTSANYPPFSWLRLVYDVLPYKYKKNLKAFYIVHPTFFTRMLTWWFFTFMASAIKDKVFSLPGLEYLYTAISRDQLEIPAYITEHDMKIFGVGYYHRSTS